MSHRYCKQYACLGQLKVGSKQRLQESLVRILAEASNLTGRRHLNTEHRVSAAKARKATGRSEKDVAYTMTRATRQSQC